MILVCHKYSEWELGAIRNVFHKNKIMGSLFPDLAKLELPSWESTSATTRTKGSAQGVQEPGHLPEAIGQVVQVSGQTN